MQGFKSVAHSKLGSRTNSSLQALPLANKGHRGWVKALAEHCDHWQSTAFTGIHWQSNMTCSQGLSGSGRPLQGVCNLSRSYKCPRVLQFHQ